jgi:hypothetical protein
MSGNQGGMDDHGLRDRPALGLQKSAGALRLQKILGG